MGANGADNAISGDLIEDLDIHPQVLSGKTGKKSPDLKKMQVIPDEVLTRKLPIGVIDIKTVFEYGELTYPKSKIQW